jgi:AraC-like DNA-binding protein
MWWCTSRLPNGLGVSFFTIGSGQPDFRSVERGTWPASVRRMPLFGIAVLDVPVTPRVRVRRWHHRWGPSVFPPGAHREVEVAWTLEGSVGYRIGDATYDVAAGSGIVVPAKVDHATSVTPGTSAGSAWIATELVCDVAASMGRRAFGCPTLLPDTEQVARVGSLLWTEAAEIRAGRLVAVEALAEALVVAVLRAAPPAVRATRDPRISAAVALMESHYAEPLGVDDLSRAAGISRAHFSRCFREALGLSPYQYLQSVRIQRARELLGCGHGVTEAALSVGYRDLGRFARAFRRQVGCAPSDVMRRAS